MDAEPTDLIGPIPAHLRSYKGAPPYYAGVAVDGGRTYLNWAEPVGERLVIVFNHAHDGCRMHVGILGPGHVLERLERIPTIDKPKRRTLEKLTQLGVDVTMKDHYTLELQAAVRMAERWVYELRERTVPRPLRTTDEAWLRRQLDGLDKAGA